MAATHSDANVIVEQVIRLGRAGDVVAILTNPGRSTRRPGMIFLNAGVLHRIGPHRQHVHLARRLAARGVACVRIDLAGVGDSPARADEPTFQASAIVDVQAAMTELTRTFGMEQFVLFGLCSGADNGLAAALADPRVIGVVALDPPTYANARAQLRKSMASLPRLARSGQLPGYLLSLARRRVRARATTGAPDAGQRREIPDRAAHGAQLAALVERGVAVLAIYSGVHGVRYNHADQLFEHFPALRGKVEVGFYPTANHSFTELSAQHTLSDLVTAWFERRFR